MLKFPRKRVAVVPIYDPDVSHGVYGLNSKVKVEFPDRHGNVTVYESSHETPQIVIPESAKERVDQGIVKYVGPDVTTVRPGDYVLFSGYTGTLIMFESEKLIVMPEEFIMCVVEMGESLEVPGLFVQVFNGYDEFKKPTYIYWPATYETAVPLLAQAFEDFKRTLKVKPDEPSNKDIERMLG